MRCFTRDVTQRKRMDQELQQTQRRLQAVFNQQFQFMAILSPDGHVLEANDTCLRDRSRPRPGSGTTIVGHALVEPSACDARAMAAVRR